MPNEVSDALKRAIYSGTTERVFILLLEINHSSLAEPIRITSDGQDTTHNGDTYTTFPFDVTLPDDRESVEPRAVLSVANFDARLVELIRSIEGPADVVIKLVLDSAPDTVERGPWQLQLTDVSYDINEIRGTLAPISLLAEPFPGAVFNVSDYQGL